MMFIEGIGTHGLVMVLVSIAFVIGSLIVADKFCSVHDKTSNKTK